MIRMATICSGIGAPEVASVGLNFSHQFVAEIEPFPSAVLAHHWPHVPNLGDMTKINGEEWRGQVDVLVGGTPCQAFSVAGKRESLNDERGNLTLKFVELCDAINPTYVVWENVPGVLSTADNAFGCFLGALSGNDGELFPAGQGWSNAGCVIGPRRKLAWRILDAQYFGLAQRRRRVFVVACPRDGADPCEILFEREGVQRHSAPSREKGEGASHDVAPCIGASGRGFERGGDTRGQDPVVACITGPITHALKAAGYAGSEDGTGRGQPVIAIQERGICENPMAGPDGVGVRTDDCAYTLEARTVPQAVAFRVHGEHSTAMTGRGTARVADECDLTRSLDSCGGYATNQGGNVVMQPVAFNVFGGNKRKDRPEGGFYVEENPDATKALDATGGLNPTCSQGGTCVAFPIQECHVSRANIKGTGTGLGGESDPMFTLQSAQPHGVATAMQVRRLVCEECEALQGFPRNYTRIPWRNKPASECPDGPRYNALGNSMAVPCMRWILERLRHEMKMARSRTSNPGQRQRSRNL